MRPTTSTTAFFNVVSELATNFAKLWKEASLAFQNNQMSEDEYGEFERIYVSFTDANCELSVGEISQNQFLRTLYDLTKDSQILSHTIYTYSLFDLLADSYIELAEINLCRNDA
jgi:hypothetical protein